MPNKNNAHEPDLSPALPNKPIHARSQTYSELCALIFASCMLLFFPAKLLAQTSLDSREDQIEKVHPNWKSIVRSTDFQSWLQRAPTTLQRLAASEDPEDAIRLITNYRLQRSPLTPRPISITRAQLTPRELFNLVSDTIIQVKAESNTSISTGSGVLWKSSISSNWIHPNAVNGLAPVAWVLTNAHVLGNDTRQVSIKIAEQPRKARVLYADHIYDIAVLEMEPTAGLKLAAVASATAPSIGVPTFAIGNPLGLNRTLTSGLVSGIRRQGHITMIQTSAPISPGNSGGGLFSESGELLGITTSKAVGGEAIGFAIPAYEIENFWDAFEQRVNLRLYSAGEPSLQPQAKEILDQSSSLYWLWFASDPTTGELRRRQARRIVDQGMQSWFSNSALEKEKARALAGAFFSTMAEELRTFRPDGS